MVTLSVPSQGLLSVLTHHAGKSSFSEASVVSVPSFNPQVQRVLAADKLPKIYSWDSQTIKVSQTIMSLTTCNTALSTRCSTEQQTVQNPVTTKTPTQAHQKEGLPKLDDGGVGGGPGRGDGGGGGGGGGGGWAGGFFFWGLLMMIGFMRDNDKEKPYNQSFQHKSKGKKRREAEMEF
eukprot:c23526_g1_i1 orf=240-773(+)